MKAVNRIYAKYPPWILPILRAWDLNSLFWQGSKSIGTAVHLWICPSWGQGWKPWLPNQG